MKQRQVARAETKQKGTRIGVIIGGAVVAVIGLVFIANAVLGGDDDSAPADSLPADSLPAASVPAADSDATSDGDGDATSAVDGTTEADGQVFEATGEFVPTGCPSPDGSADQQQQFDAMPPMCLDPEQSYSALVTTNKGEITIELDQAQAPLTVNNFVFLARNKYFDDTTCHRIIPGFVVQCGDPTATGGGDPGYKFADELPADGEYEIGSIAMANSGPDTNGSQFFIITGQQGADLLPNYSLFGTVTAGFDDTVVEMEAAGTQTGSPSEPVDIQSVVITTN